MNIKSVNNFTLQECLKYLEEYPNGDLVKEVENRLSILEKAEKLLEINKLPKVQWIDIKQFLETHKYSNNKYGIIIFVFLYIVFIIITIMLVAIKGRDETAAVQTIIMVTPIFLVIIAYLCVQHSSVLSKIYNIEKTDNDIVMIENRCGMYGVCLCKEQTIKLLLPCIYTKVYPCCDKVYICMKKNKWGVFNAELKKMVIPVEYDNIIMDGKDRLLVIKNNVKSRMTTKGYRIIE